METRSRKRAEASSSAAPSSSPPTTRASKRPRTSASAASSVLPVASRTRQSSASSSTAAMDSDHASARRERRNMNSERDRDLASDKGKEREPAEGSSRSLERVRDRDREAERILGLSFDNGGGANEDNDSENGVGILHQNFTSASSALQGLLRKLGAGLDDLLPSSAVSGSSSSHQSSRLKKILSGLRAEGEEGRQVEALTQLCELLSIGTEDSLGSFSVESFVPVLVGLLNHEINPDVMLLAARALTHLCEVLPSSCSAVVHYGAVPCFCARLLTIEYMDLAEQSLQALKKISQEHPTACLRAGALMAVLSYLDFFSTGVQRVALSTAANMCKKLPSDAADFVMEAVPLLTNLLHYHDMKVLEYASVCLTRIAEAFASFPDKLDELCNHGLVTQAAGLISLSNSGGQASLSTSTYTGLMRLLSTCASGSPLAAKTLLLLGISGILKDILSGSGLVASATVSPTLSRPPEQIYEIVNLADELLPPLPHGTVSIPIYSNALVKGTAGKRIPVNTSEKQKEANGTNNEVIAHEKLLLFQPELLQQFGMDLLPILTQIYGSSVNGPIRHRCLSVIGKLMYFSSAEMIQSLHSATNISCFLAGVLAWKDSQVLIPALQISGILMDKLPEIFSKMFVREGVVHAVEALIHADSSNTVPSQPSPPEKDADFVSGMSSRSRRYRRRSGVNLDGGFLDEAKFSTSGIAGSPPSLEAPAANNNIRAAVSELAKAFKIKYFPTCLGSTEIDVTEELLLLKNLCSTLNACSDDPKTRGKGNSKSSGARNFDTSVSMERELNGVISEMLTELGKGNGVSTFEFIGSGVVEALLNYFSCGTYGNDRVSEANLPILRQQALRRYKFFIELALPVGVKEVNEAPLSILVQKLQNALSSLERFPVVLSHPSRSSSGGSARLSSGLSALSQPFKLRLCRAQGEKSLRDYSSNIVLIDPLASLAAVEEFLWPRVQRNDNVQKTSASAGNLDVSAPALGGNASPGTSTPASGRRPTTRSRSSIMIGGSTGKESSGKNACSLKGKGKAVLKSTPDDEKGPQTRNAARRRAASEKDTEMKLAHSDSNSEDDDLDMSPVEIDDALMIDEDDVSDDEDDDHDEVLRDDSLPVCTPDKVHDVKLGDPADDSALASSASDVHTQPSASTNKTAAGRRLESTELKSGSTFSSRGAMSFAAAVAGLASVSGRGIRGSRDRYGLPHGGGVNEQNNKLTFTVGGKQLSKHMTIYQAIQRQLVLDEDDDDKLNGSEFMSTDGSRFWSDIFAITYQKSDALVDGSAPGGPLSSSKSLKSGSASNSGPDARWQQYSLLDSLLQGALPCDIEKLNPTYSILALLRVLEGLNQLSARLRVQAVSDEYADGMITTVDDLYVTVTKVPIEEFINNKLTPKLARQIQDALALCSGSLPSWCYELTKACPFLFPFETRRQYFYSTAFGLSRALHRLQQQQNAENSSAVNERGVRVGRLQRQKVRVSRNRILDSAAKVMEMYSSQKAVLEVEYFGEVGTGLGPTLEFYTLLSHDLQKVELGLWRSNSSFDTSYMQIDEEELKELNDDGTSELKKSARSRDFVQAPLGLFPRPWPPSADASEGSHFSKVIEYFRLIGRVMAKALQDGRLLDLPLSTAFYKLVLGQELDLYDILSFDTEFGKILQELQILVLRKKFLETAEGDNQRAISDLRFRGASIEDLCLDFTLPGYPDYILKEGEESTVVNIDNLEMYISLVVDAMVKTGIMRQMEAFRAGFSQVFDISSLQIFSSHELDYLICGRRELWEPETLVDHIKFDHGYTAKSPAIVMLLEIMAKFTPEQQHAFCQFVTGAPRLPPGGLAALNPKLTIVRKHSSTTNTAPNGTTTSESAGDDLPSVMTCANYLKLPPYSTKEIMYKKLLFAINEGQGSFDLS